MCSKPPKRQAIKDGPWFEEETESFTDFPLNPVVNPCSGDDDGDDGGSG